MRGHHVRNENESKKKHGDENGRGPSVSAFVIGLGVGAALAVLFAPRSGEATRDYISTSAKDGLDGAMAAAQKLTQRAKAGITEAKDRVREAKETGEKAYREAKNPPA
jgi:gas vesicle protein